jgi:hypothetical protein
VRAHPQRVAVDCRRFLGTTRPGATRRTARPAGEREERRGNFGQAVILSLIDTRADYNWSNHRDHRTLSAPNCSANTSIRRKRVTQSPLKSSPRRSRRLPSP